MKEFRVVSYKPSVAVIIASQIAERVDASYYEATHLELAGQIQAVLQTKSLNRFFDVTKLSGFEFTEYFTQEVFLNGTIPCIMSQNVRDNSVDLTDYVSITDEVHKKLIRSSLKINDIVLSYTGQYRRAAVISSELGEVHLGPNVCKLTPQNSATDSHFYSTFLNCVFGQRSLDREKTISAQPTVNMERIRALSVPAIDEKAQAYIGEKVRQAERLRQRARELESEFRAEIQSNYPDVFGVIQETGRHSRIQPKQINGSLNPGAFNPERLRVRQALLKNGGRLLHQVARIETPVAANYQANDIYIGLDAISSGNSSLSPSTIGKSKVIGAVRQLSEGVILSKLRPYLNKVSYIPPEMAKAYGSTELLCVKAKDSKSGWFIYGALKLEATIQQVNPVANGATHPRVSREDVSDLAIAWHEDYEALGEKLKQAQRNYFLSENLTTCAKYLVEGLIEGKITEQELVEAEEELQSGDREADKQILARVTRKGMDAAHEPALFGDVDALYDALSEPSAVAGG